MLGPTSFAGLLTGNIIGPRGAEDLAEAIAEASESPVPAAEVGRLSVTIDIEARATGTASVVRSGAVTYPIQVYRSKDCANGFRAKTDEPCKYVGQDRPTRTLDLAVDCL
ncbi:MAG: hypothetical protein JNG84_02280 [Archangium sp.]|nr:hypothetical protein [Archangium sp.]